MKILVTGFPPYDTHRENSTQLLIDSLRRDRPEGWDSIILEIVAFENGDDDTQQRTMLAELDRIINEHAPDVCLFCGQSPERPRVTVETLAINIFKGKIIATDGPAACWVNLPGRDSLAKRLCEAGIPAADSYYAGVHLCNHILYSALRLAEKTGNGMRCGFLHLPMISSQVIACDKDRPFITLEMGRQALIETVRHIQNCA